MSYKSGTVSDKARRHECAGGYAEEMQTFQRGSDKHSQLDFHYPQ